MLRDAQQLIEMHGNPSTRVFSLVCRVKNIVNLVNDWRSKVHDIIFKKEFYPTDELTRLLRSYPDSSPKCNEYKVFDDLIKRKVSLEKDIDDAFLLTREVMISLQTFCSLSFMQQLLDRINKFDLVVSNKLLLQQKMKLAETIQNQIQLFNEPFSPDQVGFDHFSYYQKYPTLEELENIYETVLLFIWCSCRFSTND